MQSLTGDLLHGLSIAAGVSYSRMLGKYADSPIVADAGDAEQWVGAVGLYYTFCPTPGSFCMASEEKTSNHLLWTCSPFLGGNKQVGACSMQKTHRVMPGRSVGCATPIQYCRPL